MNIVNPFVVTACAAVLPFAAMAHVPFLEQSDYTEQAPFVVSDVENSKAINAQLRTPGDVDFYRIELTQPAHIVFGSNVPFCPQYAAFGVTMALIGPGLPPQDGIPVAIRPGEGAVVVRDDFRDAAQRQVFFEPTSRRQSWIGPKHELAQVPPGVYTLVVWNERGQTGDYIAVIGDAENFGPAEIRQVRQTSPLVAHGRNLMVDCDPTRSETQGNQPPAPDTPAQSDD